MEKHEIHAELQAVRDILPSLREQVARATDTDRERLLTELHRREREETVLQAKLQALDLAR